MRSLAASLSHCGCPRQHRLSHKCSTVFVSCSEEKLAEYLFQHVIVEPKGLTPDDFDTLDEFNEVVSFARGVMQGSFRAEADADAAKAAGKK